MSKACKQQRAIANQIRVNSVRRQSFMSGRLNDIDYGHGKENFEKSPAKASAGHKTSTQNFSEIFSEPTERPADEVLH